MERDDVEGQRARELGQRPSPEPCAQVAEGGSVRIEVAERKGFELTK
jgi:hypothetical protein